PGGRQETHHPGEEGAGKLPERQYPGLGAAVRWSLPASAAHRQPEPAQCAVRSAGETHRTGNRDALKAAACSLLLTLSHLWERAAEGSKGACCSVWKRRVRADDQAVSRPVAIIEQQRVFGSRVPLGAAALQAEDRSISARSG